MRNGRELVNLPGMKQTTLIAILLPIAIAAIALPAWAVLAIKPGTEQLQMVADRACKCERRSGSKTCWQPLARFTNADLNRGGSTTCFPLSEELIEAGSGTDKFIVLRYHIVASGGRYLCSKAEAIAGEAIWYREAGHAFTEEESRIAYPRAQAALIQFADALKRGERLEKLKPAMGCVTGY